MHKIVLPLFVLLLLDQLSKRAFFDAQRGATSSFLTPVFNTGSGRSIPIPVWILIGGAVIISVIAYQALTHKALPWSIVLFLLAGAWGNTLDRIFLGGVRDFIDLHYRPIFNFADIYLTIAGVLLLWFWWNKERGEKK